MGMLEYKAGEEAKWGHVGWREQCMKTYKQGVGVLLCSQDYSPLIYHLQSVNNVSVEKKERLNDGSK